MKKVKSLYKYAILRACLRVFVVMIRNYFCRAAFNTRKIYTMLNLTRFASDKTDYKIPE